MISVSMGHTFCVTNKREAQLMLTILRDAFRGQSMSPNIVLSQYRRVTSSQPSFDSKDRAYALRRAGNKLCGKAATICPAPAS